MMEVLQPGEEEKVLRAARAKRQRSNDKQRQISCQKQLVRSQDREAASQEYSQKNPLYVFQKRRQNKTLFQTHKC